jgi:hypothetical protein
VTAGCDCKGGACWVASTPACATSACTGEPGDWTRCPQRVQKAALSGAPQLVQNPDIIRSLAGCGIRLHITHRLKKALIVTSICDREQMNVSEKEQSRDRPISAIQSSGFKEKHRLARSLYPFQRCSRQGDQLCAPDSSSVPFSGQLAFLTKASFARETRRSFILSSNTHIHANPFKRWLKPEDDESHPMC